MDILNDYLAKMLPDGSGNNKAPSNVLTTRQSQSRLLRLAEKDPIAALENLLNYSDNIADFRELIARVKRIHAARFQAIINKFTYHICRIHDYYIVCSGWIVDIKSALAGAIDAANKETVRRLLREYPEYASMAIKRAYRMLELDIGEIACKFDETFATGFEIERGVCVHIVQLQTRGIEPLWNELSHLHTSPLRAGCLPIRYAALLNNSRAINTLISHEINTRGSEMRDINMDLVNTAIAACALFNSVETLWLLITYYYSSTLDDIAARGGELYRVMDAKPNHHISVRALSSKYSHINIASMAPIKFVAKLLVDVAIAGNYESFVVLFCYLIGESKASFPEIITPVIPYMSQKMIRVIAELIPRAQLVGLDKPVKRALFRQCLRCNVPTVATWLLEWDVETLNIAAYYNYNAIHDLIVLYATNGMLSKSDSSASSASDSIEYTQMAKLCISERTRVDTQIDATMAMACYIVKANTTCAKLLLVNDYCFYVNKFDAKLRSAVDEYGNEEIRSLMSMK